MSTVRTGTPADYQACADLFLQEVPTPRGYASSTDYIWGRAVSEDAWTDDLKGYFTGMFDPNLLVVAYEGDRLVGFGWCWIEHLDNPTAVPLEDVVVDSEYRLQGVGRAIVEEMARLLGERGIHGMVAEISVSNQRLIDKVVELGFKPASLQLLWQP